MLEHKSRAQPRVATATYVELQRVYRRDLSREVLAVGAKVRLGRRVHTDQALGTPAFGASWTVSPPDRM